MGSDLMLCNGSCCEIINVLVINISKIIHTAENSILTFSSKQKFIKIGFPWESD